MESELITELYLLLHCDKCKTILTDDNKHWVECEWLDLCCKCYHKEFAYCDGCNEDYYHKDMIRFEDIDEQYCKWCLSGED